MGADAPRSERTYFNLFLREDENMRVYERQTYEMSTFLADIGGFITLLRIGGKIIVMLFA